MCKHQFLAVPPFMHPFTVKVILSENRENSENREKI